MKETSVTLQTISLKAASSSVSTPSREVVVHWYQERMPLELPVEECTLGRFEGTNCRIAEGFRRWQTVYCMYSSTSTTGVVLRMKWAKNTPLP